MAENTGKIDYDNTALWTEPGSQTIIRNLSAGTEVEILSRDVERGRTQVRTLDDDVGWVASISVRVPPVVRPRPQPFVTPHVQPTPATPATSASPPRPASLNDMYARVRIPSIEFEGDEYRMLHLVESYMTAVAYVSAAVTVVGGIAIASFLGMPMGLVVVLVSIGFAVAEVIVSMAVQERTKIQVNIERNTRATAILLREMYRDQTAASADGRR